LNLRLVFVILLFDNGFFFGTCIKGV